MQDQEAVAAVVEQWRLRFEASDAAGMKALWAQDHGKLTYLATEIEEAMKTWPEISEYYDNTCGLLNVKEWRVWDIVTDVISPTTAFAWALTDFLYESDMEDHPSGLHYWQGRISFTLLKQKDEWKIIHYEDSTLLQRMLPLVQQYQRPKLDRAIAAVKAGNSATALAELEALQADITFGLLTSNEISKRVA